MNIVDIINGKTKLYGLLGNPVEHTKSPFIHNTLFNYFNINSVYIPIQVDNDCLEKAAGGIRAQNYSGCNVTVPYKKEIIKYLDDISNDALLMGAVNTVKNINGRLKGYNTDGEGFVRDFKDGFNTDFKGKKVLMLGAGGTARALAIKLASEKIEHLTIVNRTAQNAENIAELVKNNYGSVANWILPDSKDFIHNIKSYEIIINTTPAGMSTYMDTTPFDRLYELDRDQLVYDVIYTPRKTKFLRQAEECGCKTRNGFGMLINQGIAAFEIWTGKTVSRDLAAELLKLIDKLEDLNKI